MPSDFLSRHVKVESAAVKVDPNLCGKKSFRIDSKALCDYITKETKAECVEKSESFKKWDKGAVIVHASTNIAEEGVCVATAQAALSSKGEDGGTAGQAMAASAQVQQTSTM